MAQDAASYTNPSDLKTPIPPATEAGKSTPSPEEVVIDYKAENERLSRELGQARYSVQKEKQKRKELEAPAFDEEKLKALVEEQVNERIDSEVQARREKDAQHEVDNQLMTIQDPDKRELVRLIYEKKLVKTGFSTTAIREDLQSAELIADTKKIVKRNTELQQALIARNTTGTAGAGSNLDRPAYEEDPSKSFNAAELRLLGQAKVKEGTMKELSAQLKKR